LTSGFYDSIVVPSDVIGLYLYSTMPGKHSDVEGRDMGPVRYTTASEHGSVV